MPDPADHEPWATCRAFWTVAAGRGEIRTGSLAPVRPGDVLVRTKLSAISRGSESLVFAGRVPESQWATMRCPFQEGDFPAPVKYGYISVGTVERGPEALRGRRVFCLHPHQDRYVVPEQDVILIPDAVPDERAVLAANLETAVNGLWDGPPRIGDRVAVVGAGVVGALAAALAARVPGTRVQLVDIDPARAELAKKLGLAFAMPDDADGDADLVIHASGAAGGLDTSLSLAGFEATVIELSWYGDAPVAALLGAAFHARRLTLRSSQVGSVATARRARRTRESRLALALRLLADPIFDALIGGRSDFSELPETMARLARAPDSELCHIVEYS